MNSGEPHDKGASGSNSGANNPSSSTDTSGNRSQMHARFKEPAKRPANARTWEQCKKGATAAISAKVNNPNSLSCTVRRRWKNFSCDDDQAEVEAESIAPNKNFEHDTGASSSGQSDTAGESNDNASITSNESFTLRDRQDAINTVHPFGIRIWKPAVYKKKRSVEENADADIHHTDFGSNVPYSVRFGNLVWTVTFGLVLFAACLLAAASVLVFGGFNDAARRYGKSLYLLAFYLLWPSGKYVQLVHNENYWEEDAVDARPVTDYLQWQGEEQNQGRLFFPPRARRPSELVYNNGRRWFGRGEWSLARVMFYVWFHIVLTPLILILSTICWLSVVGVPVARVMVHLWHHMRTHPLALRYRPTSSITDEEIQRPERYSILLCTYRAFGLKYYKYTVGGINIIILNLMSVVIFVILDFYVLNIMAEAPRFILSLLAIVPLAHFIGQAVASISAQSSMSMGATLNAFFATIVEVYLYIVALTQGKGEMVEGSVMGSILAGTLLLPGVSMCAGAFKRKTQRFNPKSTSVTSTLLLFGVLGAIAPTMFYNIYGPSEITCDEESNRCWQRKALLTAADVTDIYIVRQLALICAGCLFLAYACGLVFTLRTHAALIWASSGHEEDEAAGHDTPTWGQTKSYAILLGATWMYAIIAEVLVDSVDFVLRNISISQRLLGITIFALVPNTTEFMNAISFAMQGNVSLSLEIGSAYALQVCLLQVPCLVFASMFFPMPETGPLKDTIFTMIFPQWDVLTSLICFFVFTNVHTEGKSNYFKGFVLILTYIVAVSGYFFIDKVDFNGTMSMAQLAQIAVQAQNIGNSQTLPKLQVQQ